MDVLILELKQAWILDVVLLNVCENAAYPYILHLMCENPDSFQFLDIGQVFFGINTSGD